jgi:hypothetical protein
MIPICRAERVDIAESRCSTAALQPQRPFPPGTLAGKRFLVLALLRNGSGNGIKRRTGVSGPDINIMNLKGGGFGR